MNTKLFPAILAVMLSGWSQPKLLLIRAAQTGRAADVTMLMEIGSDVNGKDYRGNTALMLACAGGHMRIVESLLANGADVNARNYAGTTALMLAARAGRTELVKFLLNNGANVNDSNWIRETALLQAASGGCAGAVKALLKAGADARAKNFDGFSAYDYAAQNAHADIANILSPEENPMTKRLLLALFVLLSVPSAKASADDGLDSLNGPSGTEIKIEKENRTPIELIWWLWFF